MTEPKEKETAAKPAVAKGELATPVLGKMKEEKAVEINLPIKGRGENWDDVLIEASKKGGVVVLAVGGTGFAYKAVKDGDLSSALIAGLSWLGSAFLLSS